MNAAKNRSLHTLNALAPSLLTTALLATALLAPAPARADDPPMRKRAGDSSQAQPASPAPAPTSAPAATEAPAAQSGSSTPPGRVRLPGMRRVPAPTQQQPAPTQQQPAASTPPVRNLPQGGQDNNRRPPAQSGSQTPGSGGSGQWSGGQWSGGNRHDDDRNRYHDGDRGHYHLRRVDQIPDRDRHGWAQGHWSHGSHNGFSGWWWVLGASWYYYDNPYYPYPSPDSPSALVIDSYDDDDGQASQPVIAESSYRYYCPNPQGYYPTVQACNVEWTTVAVSPEPQPISPPQTSYWYYCESPRGYYPYVQSCRVDWTPVASTPTPANTPAPTAYWYYCRNPRGYYPAVDSCYSDWVPVPAQQ